MTGPEQHPSCLELDRVALGAPPGPGVGEHLADCPACAAQVGRLQVAPPVPAWARELAAPRPRPARWAWASLATGAAALAVALALPLARAPRPPPATSAKGAPAIALYVQRGPRVALWDGRSPLAAGDRVQLEIASPGYRHVAVALRAAGGRWEPLYRGLVSAGGGPLPESWRLDGAPGPETLGVAFSRDRLEDAELAGALDGRARDARVWTTVLVLPKQEATAP